MKFISSKNINSLNCSKSKNKFIHKNLISSFTRLLILIAVFNLITKTESATKQKEKKAASRDSLKYLTQSKSYPDELEEISKMLSKQSKECFSEIAQIYSKDFSTNEGKNPYLNKKNKALAEKYFEKVNNQIWKKLNKISFLESKNFTGVRWIEFKSSNNTELKRMMDSHLGLLSDYLQKNFLKNSLNANSGSKKAEKEKEKEKDNNAAANNNNAKKTNNNNNSSKNSKSSSAVVYMNLPEIIVDSYQYFYSKINELKKFFSKFYLFKAIGKFNSCLAAKEKQDVKALFAESVKSGKITIKTLLENLKDIYSISLELVKAEHIADFVKALKRLLLIVKGIPGM